MVFKSFRKWAPMLHKNSLTCQSHVYLSKNFASIILFSSHNNLVRKIGYCLDSYLIDENYS